MKRLVSERVVSLQPQHLEGRRKDQGSNRARKGGTSRRISREKMGEPPDKDNVKVAVRVRPFNRRGQSVVQ